MATEIDGDREWNEVCFERGSDSTGVLCRDILGAKLARQQGWMPRRFCAWRAAGAENAQRVLAKQKNERADF